MVVVVVVTVVALIVGLVFKGVGPSNGVDTKNTKYLYGKGS